MSYFKQSMGHFLIACLCVCIILCDCVCVENVMLCDYMCCECDCINVILCDCVCYECDCMNVILCDYVCCMSVAVWMYVILYLCVYVWLCVCVPFWTVKWWNTTQTAGPSPLGLLSSLFPTVSIPPDGLVSAASFLHGQWKTLSGHWPLERRRENCSCGPGSSKDVFIPIYRVHTVKADNKGTVN